MVVCTACASYCAHREHVVCSLRAPTRSPDRRTCTGCAPWKNRYATLLIFFFSPTPKSCMPRGLRQFAMSKLCRTQSGEGAPSVAPKQDVVAASHSALCLVLRVRRDDSASPQTVTLLSVATVTAIVAVDSPITVLNACVNWYVRARCVFVCVRLPYLVAQWPGFTLSSQQAAKITSRRNLVEGRLAPATACALLLLQLQRAPAVVQRAWWRHATATAIACASDVKGPPTPTALHMRSFELGALVQFA